MREPKHRNAITAIVLLLAVLGASRGLFDGIYRGKLMASHDAGSYAMFLTAFHDNVAHGNLFPVWNQYARFGFGEPQLEFRPPLQSYTAELSYLFIPNLFRALYPPGILFIAAAALGMYLLAARLWRALAVQGRDADARGWYFALFAAFAYVLSPYFLCDIYVRGAFSEASCFAVFPWLALAFIELATAPSARSLAAAAIAYAALASSHASIFFFTTPLIVALAFAYRRQVKSPALFAVALALGLLASSFYWLPAFAEKDLVKSALLAVDFESYPGHFVRLDQLIYTPPGSGNVPYGIGPFALLGIIWGLWLACAPGHVGSPLASRELRGLALTLLGCCLACVYLLHRTSAIWYEAVPWLQIMSFPWRFLTLIAFFGTLLGALAAASLFKDYRPWVVTGILLFFLGVAAAQPPAGYHTDDPEAYSGKGIVREGIGFLKPYSSPASAGTLPHAPTAKLVEFARGRGDLRCDRLGPTRASCDVMAIQDSTLRLNVLDYPNWAPYVDGRRALPTAIARDALAGTPLLALAPGKHSVEWRLEDTAARSVSKVLSFLAWLALAALLFKDQLAKAKTLFPKSGERLEG
jgi:hypothetical protein